MTAAKQLATSETQYQADGDDLHIAMEYEELI